MGQGEGCDCTLGRCYVLVGTIDNPAGRERVVKTGEVGSKRQRRPTSASVPLLPPLIGYSPYEATSHDSRKPR